MWNQTVVNEKVYTVSLFFFTIVSWLMIEWTEDPDGPGADRLLILVAFLLGLGYSNHPAGFLCRCPRLASRFSPCAGGRCSAGSWSSIGFGALVLGLTPFIYEPVRAAYFPAINEGAPTACETKIEAACTFRRAHQGASDGEHQSRTVRAEAGARRADYSAQVGMWWLYFKWQWLRDVHQTHRELQFDARLCLPRARVAGRLRALGTRPTNFLVLRAADVHDDARAHLLPEFQVRVVAGP